jgi:branched-chain amino acid transport system permease protein
MPVLNITDIATLGAIQGIAALGLYVQVRTGQLSVASGTMGGLGAAICLRVVESKLPFEFGLAAAFVVGGTAGLVLSLGLWRLRGLLFALGTLVFAALVQVLASGVPALGGSLGLTDARLYTELNTVIAILGVLVIAVAVKERSSTGLTWAALREREEALVVSAISSVRVRVTWFAIGSGIIAMSGAFMLHYLGYMSPDAFGVEPGLELLLCVQLLGTSVPIAPIASSFILVALNEALRPLADNRILIYAVLLVVLTIVRERRWAASVAGSVVKGKS